MLICLSICYAVLYSTDTVVHNGVGTKKIFIQCSGQRKLDCGQHVDSRPPPSKFSWKRDSNVQNGSSTYLLQVKDLRYGVTVIQCTAYDIFGK